MATIIDTSETIPLLAVAPLETLIIEHDKGTPKHTGQVRVSAKGITLGLGSTILVQHNAELILNSVVAVNVLGTLDIGNHGKLFLNSAIGANLLNAVNFDNHAGPATLLINTADVELTGSVNGFGAHDNILLGGMAATTGTWTQAGASGTLALYNSGGVEVGSIGLTGTYKSADFDVRDNESVRGTYTTNVTFIGPDAHASPAENGFSVPEPVAAGAAAASYGGSVHELSSVEAAASNHMMSFLSHH